jgi:hypothetical protein
MPSDFASRASPEVEKPEVSSDYFRFHAPHLHLGSLYGEDWFALKAEAFAHFSERLSLSLCKPSLLRFFRQRRGISPFRHLPIHSPEPCVSVCRQLTQLR